MAHHGIVGYITTLLVFAYAEERIVLYLSVANFNKTLLHRFPSPKIKQGSNLR